MTVRILQGDCRDVLKTLPDESVHCVVTSPPYWGLRDYGTAAWKDGDPGCDHSAARIKGNRFDYAISEKQASNAGSRGYQASGRECPCGATRVDRQIGLEVSPLEYVDCMVAVFAEVRRVLRSDGTLWLNLGDCYNAYNGGAGPSSSLSAGAQTNERPRLESGYGLRFKGLKPKDLVGVPWRVALALQADGWWLRQDIIWHKPNPMPESIQDRCTKAHEYIFLLTKAERYYYNADAIREPLKPASVDRGGYPHNSFGKGQFAGSPTDERHQDGKAVALVSDLQNPDGANKRSVWTVTTKPFADAHFATFPPDLIEPCILAGSAAGGTVLDPFGGAGTTGLVADRHHRDAILIELNPEYAEMARKRIVGDAPLFAEVTA